ncbi:MAG: ATP phosphoribosyltransferase regulatory subunit, partial [Bacillota bacterium]
IDYLTEADKAHFDKVKRALDAMQIPYEVDDNLVRGLDYYTQTVFELKVSKELLGNQNAICGGGRYNELVETLDGPATPAVGFAFGIERLIVALQAAKVIEQDEAIHAYILTLGERAKEAGLALMQRFRMGGLITNMDFLDKSMKAQFKQSDHQNAKVVIILGEDELNKGVLQIKDQRSKEEHTVEINQAYQFLVDLFTKKTTCEDCDCEKGHE